MIRNLFILLVLLIFIPQLASAQTTILASNSALNFELPSDRWEVSVDPPELAIEAMLVDMAHDKKKKGEEIDLVTLRALSEKFMKVNNLFIYNPATEAYLMVSLSPQNRAESRPTEKSIQASVHWAVDALDDHAEVEDLNSYQTVVQSVVIPGVEYATQITSSAPLFGDSHNFIGVIGYSYPHWVFLYYNDKARDSKDLFEMEQIIKSIELTDAPVGKGNSI